MDGTLTLIPTYLLFVCIGVLFLLSAFFSGSETALMSVNRYHLANLAGRGHRSAKIALRLLQKPERLIGLILLGNNLINILIAQLTTYVGYRLYGEIGIAIATGALTFAILIFAEVAPKTLAVSHAKRASLLVAPILALLGTLAAPLVWLITAINERLLKLLGASTRSSAESPLTHEELRAALVSSRRNLKPEYQDMLLNILDLESIAVRDVMVPLVDLAGINLDDGIEDIRNDLNNVIYTRMPVYRGNVNQIEGYIHIRDALPMLCKNELSEEALQKIARPCEYIHESTNLLRGLLEFKRMKRHFAFVVDEYGDIQGLVTLEDLLEEIVGDFTRDAATYDRGIIHDADGSVIVDANFRVDELNESLNWNLDSGQAGTINGLILERMERIPEPGTSIMINRHPVEILRATNKAVRTVKIRPPVAAKEKAEE